MYYQRALNPIIKNISETFPVLLITGPRQVGKTTLLEQLKENTRSYVTLDDLDERILAQKILLSFYKDTNHRSSSMKYNMLLSYFLR